MARSGARGSLTFTIMSAWAKISFAVAAISAPTAAYSSLLMPEPDPASDSTNTRCPRRTSSSTPTAVMLTRYSCVLISLGTPTIIYLNSDRRPDPNPQRKRRVTTPRIPPRGGGRLAPRSHLGSGFNAAELYPLFHRNAMRSVFGLWEVVGHFTDPHGV